MTYDATDSDDDGVVEADVDNSLVDTKELDINSGKHRLITSGSILQYDGDVAGLRSMVTDAVQGDILLPAPGSYDLGTTGLTLPDLTGFGTLGSKRTVELQVSDGIGTALQAGNASYLQGFAIIGDGAGTQDDTGIKGAVTATGPTMFNVEVQNMWKSLHLDASFNARVGACQFSNSRTGQSQGASVHIDTAGGSNNDCRFIYPYFGENATRMVEIEAHDVSFVHPHGEGNAGDALYHHTFGGGLTITGANHHKEAVSGAGYKCTDTGATPNSVRFDGTLDRDPGLAAGATAIDAANVDEGVFHVTTIGSWNTKYANLAGDRRIVNGVGEEASGGTPTASRWETGDVVEDANNPGDTYSKNPSGFSANLAGGGSNVPAWSEDGNSPINFSGASTQYTLASAYDLVKVLFQTYADVSGAAQNLRLRVNGDANANYNYTFNDGTVTSGATEFQVSGVDGNGEVKGSMQLAGRWSDHLTLTADYASRNDGSGVTAVGVNETVASPLDSITFFGSGGDVEVEARVYGWNGGIA